jgi:hypothetical protein
VNQPDTVRDGRVATQTVTQESMLKGGTRSLHSKSVLAEVAIQAPTYSSGEASLQPLTQVRSRDGLCRSLVSVYRHGVVLRRVLLPDRLRRADGI